MKNYCDFNPTTFSQFTSMKEKIIPQLADDWEINPNSYIKNDGFSIYSKKLNQEIADIDLRGFLYFVREHHLDILDLKIQGTFIVGKDRKLYTEKQYLAYKKEYDKKLNVKDGKEQFIARKDLKNGHKYKSACGKEYIYVKSLYTILPTRNKKGTTIPKPTKKYFITNHIKSALGTIKSTLKFVEDLGYEGDYSHLQPSKDHTGFFCSEKNEKITLKLVEIPRSEICSMTFDELPFKLYIYDDKRDSIMSYEEPRKKSHYFGGVDFWLRNDEIRAYYSHLTKLTFHKDYNIGQLETNKFYKLEVVKNG